MTRNERIAELLVAEATDGLTGADRSELNALLSGHRSVDRYEFQRAVAAVFLAVGAAQIEQLPSTLRSKLVRDAEERHNKGA